MHVILNRQRERFWLLLCLIGKFVCVHSKMLTNTVTNAKLSDFELLQSNWAHNLGRFGLEKELFCTYISLSKVSIAFLDCKNQPSSAVGPTHVHLAPEFFPLGFWFHISQFVDLMNMYVTFHW